MTGTIQRNHIGAVHVFRLHRAIHTIHVTTCLSSYTCWYASLAREIKIDQKPVLKALREWLRVSPNQEFVLVNLKNKGPMNSLQIIQKFCGVWAGHILTRKILKEALPYWSAINPESLTD